MARGDNEASCAIENKPDVLAHPFAPSCLDHELASECNGRLNLEGSQHYGLIERVSGHDGPVVKHRQRHGLPLRVATQICLETERLNNWQHSVSHIKRRASLGKLLHDHATAAADDIVNGSDAIGRRSDFNVVHRFHQAGRSHQKRRVGNAARCGDNLPTTSVQRRRVDRRVNEAELHISDGFIAKRTFSASPLKSLDN